LVADGDPVEVTAAYREQVRQRDEVEMTAKFSMLRQNWALDDAIRIVRVTVGSSHRPGPASVLNVGEDAWIAVELSIAEAARVQDLRLWIERLDGLRVTENSWAESGGVRNPLVGEVDVMAEMAPLILGPGLYRVQVALVNGTTTLATAGAVFKVVAERNLSGGQPALWAPVEVSCRPRVVAER